MITLTTILNQLPALTFVTVGMTLVLIVACIDLSVGSVMGFCASVVGVAVVVDEDRAGSLPGYDWHQ